MMLTARPWRPRSVPLPLAVMVGVLALAVGGIVALSAVWEADDVEPSGGDREVVGERAALRAYADTLSPVTEDVGKAIVLGIRPDITDFLEGRISVEVWEADMDARRQQFEAARRAFAAAPAPDVVGDAPEWFDRAFVTYLDAVDTLRRAGAAEGPAREDLVDRGAALGDRGDDLFDRGTALLQAGYRSLGLPPDSRFTSS